eukprot:8015022-Pyramimonas_sp.AAC.1
MKLCTSLAKVVLQRELLSDANEPPMNYIQATGSSQVVMVIENDIVTTSMRSPTTNLQACDWFETRSSLTLKHFYLNCACELCMYTPHSLVKMGYVKVCRFDLFMLNELEAIGWHVHATDKSTSYARLALVEREANAPIPEICMSASSASTVPYKSVVNIINSHGVALLLYEESVNVQFCLITLTTRDWYTGFCWRHSKIVALNLQHSKPFYAGYLSPRHELQ